MAFYFRLRYKFDAIVKNKGEAARLVEAIRLKSQLGEYYDGETIEMLDEPTSFVGKAVKQLFGR